MGLSTGERIGRFEVVELVGAGAMGEVYRARDPELERDVAIKVLPADFARDPSRLRRFEREARAVGRLDHPNLLAIHDIGRHQEAPYLVCELLEGRTLAEHLDGSRAQSHERILEWGIQIANGLAAAHDAGVVHRDLKPANLFVTIRGRVKILDFGLAKLEVPAEEVESQAPTRTNLSEHGMLLGTMAYMAPEQAAGKPVDHRADQFALGAVLYEMLAGERPFSGETAAETLSALLRDEPEPLARVAPRTPAPLRWIVERCLSRDPNDRYEATQDLVRELEAVPERLAELSARTPGSPEPRKALALRSWPLVAGLTAGALALTATISYLAGRAGAEGNQLRYERITVREGTIGGASFEPGDESIFYSATFAGAPELLHLHRPGSLDPLSIGPPNSRHLWATASGDVLLLVDLRGAGPFHHVGELARMSIAGAPRILERSISDAVASQDGGVAALVREVAGTAVLEFPPGNPRLTTTGMLLHLRLSPTGDRVALVETPGRGRDRGEIVVLGRDEGAGTPPIRLGSEIGWGIDFAPSGEEIWFADANAISALRLDGSQRRVATFPTDVFLFDVAPDGRVLLSIEDRLRGMAGRRADGPVRELTWRSWSVPFDISPDGETILFNECTKERCRVALRGFGADPPVELGEGFGMSLSPDREWVLSLPPWSPNEVSLIATRTADRRELVLEQIERISIAKWSPDGESVLLNANLPGGHNRIFRLDPATAALAPLTPEGVAFGFFAVSPDGRSLAAPRIDGTLVVYDLEGGEPPLVLDHDEQPIQWSDDGLWLYTVALSRAPVTLHRVSLADGAVEPLAVLAPPDPVGVFSTNPVVITPDGSTYVYGYERRLSDLFVVEGLR
ncbi:MAG TPA: WD40 repeat domain-containing serine/threonine protein kinase [Thermoanaerobaculia bacterium]|nr:WD40 repeat domain-containing serine/threonine protein kinase [Thermoanaerobaculia bacterium]